MVARTIIGTCPTPDVSRHTPINFDNRMLDPLMAALLMGAHGVTEDVSSGSVSRILLDTYVVCMMYVVFMDVCRIMYLMISAN